MEESHPPLPQDSGSLDPSQPNDEPDLESHIQRSTDTLLKYVKPRLPNLDEEMFIKAVRLSLISHQNQYRKSGVPYVEHPFEVAKLLADYNMDTTTLVAGLLHDVVEDTRVELSSIKVEFGEDVAFLVDAVTKISAIQAKSRIEQQAETFRKMLLSMARDFRVIMIKFADRMHNMRTLGYMVDEKKKLIAQETIEVYAPLAHRFGLSKIRCELEDLAFRVLNPNAYRDLVKQVVEKRAEREAYTRSLIGPIKDALDKAGISAKVYGRPKHFYSIYKKMQNRGCKIEDLYDLTAFRLIVADITTCYAALGVVHNLWTPLQSRFKDYIAAPKTNLYQSLHTTLIGPGSKPIEIQIRTDEMDLTAEQGIAAHWAYKEKKSAHRVEQESRWLQQFVEWQQELKDSSEFMDFMKIETKTEEIFVFTPQGDVVQLPLGATTLDYAFAIHSQVGLKCVGARVEGKIIGIDKVLVTGTTIEILKSETQHPTRDWLRIATTPKARNNIRRYLRTAEQEQTTLLGKELLEREFRSARVSNETKQNLDNFKNRYGSGTWEELWLKIGTGEITVGSLASFISSLEPKKKLSVFSRVSFKRKTSDEAVLVNGMDNMMIRFATCCHPIPGDSITGYVTRGRGVSVHRANCPEVLRLKENEKDRIIPVIWQNQANNPFEVFVEVQGRDREGLLNEISTVFKESGVNIVRASIATVKGVIRNRFLVQVHNLEQLDQVFLKLRKIKEIKEVTRKFPQDAKDQGKASKN